MIYSFTAVVIILCCYQSNIITASDSSEKDDDTGIFWNGLSEQDDANNYIQNVQNFWTDQRVGAADPRPMPTGENYDNDARSFGSGGKIRRLTNFRLLCIGNITFVLIFLGESIIRFNKGFWLVCVLCFFILHQGFPSLLF